MEKHRFWLYRRAGVYYLQDSETRKRESLNTRNRREAEQIRVARNQASDHPQVGIALAKAYLMAQDPELAERTWQHVIDEFCSRGKPQTRARRRRATNRAPLNRLAERKLVETTADERSIHPGECRWRICRHPCLPALIQARASTVSASTTQFRSLASFLAIISVCS